MFLRLLPFCTAEMKLIIGFGFALESQHVRAAVALMEWRVMGIGGDGGKSVFLEAEEVKPEMMKMREIMGWPGVRVEMRLKLAC